MGILACDILQSTQNGVPAKEESEESDTGEWVWPTENVPRGVCVCVCVCKIC